MSKREIRAKRLVAAVLLAISVQMWSAPPLWAAEASVQTETSAAGEAKETKETKDAKAADSETGGEADAGEEETVVVPVIGYSTRSAAGSDYGVMPLADTAVDGALTGVTGINGSELVVDKVNNNFFIGTTEYGGFDKKSKNRAVIGLGIYVDPSDNISVFGTSAEGHGESASAFGYNASADEFSSVFGSGANAASNGSAFGYNAEAVEQYANAFGSGAVAGDNYTIAFGYSAKSAGSYSIAVGSEAIVEVARGIAIGTFAHIEKYEGYADSGNIAIGTEAHTNALYSMAIGDCADSTFKNSIAIGASSNTTAENQVSFGTGVINTINGNEVVTWTDRRSLAGISDIEMAGALTGVTSINGSVLAAMNEDVTNKSLAIGAGAVFMDPDSSVTTISKNAIAIGNGTKVLGDGSLAIGYYAYQRVGAFAGGIESIAINGWVSLEANYNIAIGGSVVDADNVVAIGYNAASDSSNAVAIGSNTYASYDGTALGYAAQGTYHNAVAIGAYSGTTEENQVSFGHKVGDRNYADGSDYSDDLFRSLVNVADIDMHGNISLGGEWKENTTSGLYESNGKGELNGVTSINGVIFAKDSMNNQEGLLIGTPASGTSFYGDASVMIGLNIDNSAIDAVGIGNYAKVRGDGSVAIGYGAEAMSNMAMYPTAIGFFARAIGDEVVAIGGSSYAVHEFSVALGDDSSTSAENQVSFGHKAGDKYGDGGRDIYGSDLFRSLVNVADIEMHGALTGVTGIDGVTVSGTDASTGLTVGGNAVIGKTDTPFSSTGFAVAKDGAVTAKTVNGATIRGTGFNGVTLSTDGKVNGAAITSNSFNGVKLEKGADSHYKVGGVDVTKMQTDVAGKADAATTLTGYGITDAYTKTETDTAVGKKADKATTLTGYGIADAYTKTETDTAIGKKADKATTLTGYGIADAYTKTETDTAIGKKADKATTLTGYGIADAYTKTETDTAIGKKADKATTLTGYGIADAYTKTETDTAIGKKADKATTLTGYGIADAYTKTAADAKITAATADMATKTQVTADIGTAKTALESAYQAADTALGSRSAALETKTAKFNTAGDNLTGMANITSTAATLGGVGFASAGVMTGVASIDGIAIDASRNLSNAGTYNGVTVAAAGISGTSVFNGAAITNNSFNGVTLEKGADNHYKVGGVDVSALKTTVDSISADGVGTADTAGIKRDTTGTATTTIETNTKISSSGITTNKATVSGATATTLENGKLTVGAATVQNTGFAVGSSSLNNGSLTVDGNNKLTTAGLTASKVTVGTVTVSGGKVSGLTDAALSAVSTEAVTGKQLNATNTTVSALDTAYKAADTQIRTDFAAADTTLQNNIDAKVAQTAYDTKMSALDSADNALSGRATALETKTAKFNTAGDNLTGMANITSTAATLGGVGFASAGVMTGVASIDGIAIDASRNLSNAGTYNGVTVAAAGISGTSVFNGAAITNNSFNGVTLEKGADNHYKVGGVDVSALKTTVDSISADGVGTADTAGIKRDTTGTATTTIETNTKISSSGITTNKATVSGATATTLENGKLTVGAATVQNTGFAVGSSSLNNGSLTVDGNNKLTTAGLTASKVTVGTVTVSGGKVSGLTDAALSAVSTEAVTGKQLNATNTTVSALDTAYKAADTQIRTDFAAADTALKTELNTAIDEKAKKATDLAGYGITDAYTKTAADEKITAATADMATKTQVTADIGTAKTALESAYQAADTALSNRAAALETAATGMSYDAGKNTTTFTGGVTATVLTAGEFKVGATGFGFGNDGALTAKTVNGIEIKKDESKVMVGGIDLTALSNGDVVTDNTKGIGRNQDTATTTIETNTAISSSGITTNAVTASGTVKAGEFVEGSQKLSDKYAAKTALADYTTTTDMNTKFADYATTTAVDTKLADYAKSDSVYSKAAADTAFAKAGDVDTLKTTVGDADGGLVKDVTELQSGKADKATTLAGYGIADAYTQTEINEKIVEATKDLATSATVTDIQSGLDEVTGKTAGLSYDTASGSSKFSGSVVIGNEGAKTHTQITDDAIIFGEGTDKQVTVDASGIHVGKKAAGGIALYADADGTHIDHTSLVTGSVTADNLNGVAISGNATDGLSVGGVSIKALSERLDSLEQDGVATADMGGIKRTDVVENSGKTIIEDTTSFTKDGLKTANLEAATAALGGVNFAAGAVTGVSSINGVVFGSDGKIGGVSLSGGKVDGVDVGWLDQRVKSLEDNGTGGGGTGGGGSSANTSGIHKPDRDTTNIEGNTSITTDGIDTNKVNASDSIVVADGEKNKTVISKDGILVAEGEKNQVKINEDGIHVGKNSSVVNDTDGFITDKGLYIGVSSSSDTSTAKFSVAPNGNLSSKAGDYGFSNTSADGAKFTHSGDTAYGTGSQLDTTIQGNKVTTGRIDTDELYVDGNKVTVAGGTIGQTDAVDNHLSGTDADGNTVTNDFKTSAVNGTTQAAEKTSADGKESTKTVNNTSAGGTGVTTSRTTTDSKDNVTVKESSFGTNEKGMTLSTSNKVTDKDGKVTKDTSGTTTMTGDSISVSKTTTTTEKDADGNEKEVTKTSGTTIGSGEVTLKREDGSTIEVGSAIEGMQSDMRELDGRVNRMGVEIKEVGALSAALAGLHPQPENANSRADFAMAMGSYEGKQALAVGGFYRPDKRTMLSIGASTTSSKHMMNMGISIALDRLPEAERRAKEAARAAGVEQETLNRVLERLAALEQDNRRLQADNEKRDVAYEKLAADYTQLKEKYIEETADRQQPEQAEAEE